VRQRYGGAEALPSRTKGEPPQADRLPALWRGAAVGAHRLAALPHEGQLEERERRPTEEAANVPQMRHAVREHEGSDRTLLEEEEINGN
jgi:hypothetical protein